MNVSDKAQHLLDELTRIGPVAVAFSGGTDSALVLAAAVRAVGADNVAAITADSASLAAAELTAARDFAAALGVDHIAARTDELSAPGYAANGRDRCYFCKATVLARISAVASTLGLPQVATGTNADDARDAFRPGIRAGDELAVRTPLRDLRMTKQDVRAVSRGWRLSTSDKPASACLASRIRYGIQVTPARLARIERAELAVRLTLREWGVPVEQIRVRDLGDSARLELDPLVLAKVDGHPELVAAVGAAGFADVRFAPYRPGALNHEP